VAEVAGHVRARVERRSTAGASLDIDDKQFEDWTHLLETRTGLFIAPERRGFLANGIRSRMRLTGCRDFGEYYRRLSSSQPQSQEWSTLIACLTVHETRFFRHRASMKLVEEVLLPDVFDQGRAFHAWSVGCATGEETYSLAMLADARYREQSRVSYFRVTGTDISLPALRQARVGMYLNCRGWNIREEFMHTYCRQVTSSRFEVRAALRERVCFAQFNLRGGKEPPVAKLNLIYCQNVLIYYDRQRRLQIVDLLAQSLRPGGLLILGPGEILDWQHPAMERVRHQETLVYRRKD
jgi:type IV pilus assembly protein PilK